MKKKKINYLEDDVLTIDKLYDMVISEDPQLRDQIDFYQKMKDVLNMFIKGLDKKDVLNMQAKSSMLLLEKLIEENNIFSYIKPTKKRQLPKKNTISTKSKGIKKAPKVKENNAN